MFQTVTWGLLAAALVAAPEGKPAAAAAGPTLPRCPAGWRVEVVAEVPRVKHPSVVCCAPDGRVFVAEDPMDMGADASRPGDRILCLHPDGRVTVFAEGLYAVFGLAYIDGKVYVHHCPKFSVFTDAGGVGKDRTDLIGTTNPRPNTGMNDHIPSNIRLGMDGWLYMSIGDKGLHGAVGTDGSRAEIHGGGILRLRPDGSHLEAYSTGTRNHLDLAVNDEDEIFTYDNTDDGNGWWTRLTHMVDGGYYGYPWDYKPRRPYTLWMMTDYGGGAPTGALAYNEDALPARYRGNLFLCEWGRKQLLRVTVGRAGGSFRVTGAENFLTAGTTEFRPVGIAAAPDGMALYVTDWCYGGWKQNVTVGRLLKVTYTGGKSEAAPKPGWYVHAATARPFEATTTELVEGLKHPAQSVRLVAQRRLAERGSVAVSAVTAVLADPKAPAFARWSAIWTLDAIDAGAAGRAAITAALADADPSVRRQAARQLGNRAVKAAAPELIKRLTDADPSVRFQAATALGRIGDKAAVGPLLRALSQTDLFARYAAFTALNRIGRADPTAWPRIVAGLADPTPAVREATAFVLRDTFDEPLAAALCDFASAPEHPAAGRVAALGALAGLSHEQAPWDGGWWGTQPVKTPKPVPTVEWAGTAIAAGAVRALLKDPDPAVRVAAVEAAAEVRSPETTGELASAFAGSSDPALKRSVLRVLATVKATAAGTDLVVGVLAEPDENAALLTDAVAAAGHIGGPKMVEALTRFAERPVSAPALAGALDGLGKLKSAASAPVAARHLTHADAGVRAAAVDALAGIGGDPAVTAVLPLLADKRAGARRTAVAALGAVRNRSAVGPLLKAFADPETRLEAAAALAATPDVRALDAYLEGLASRDAAARGAAREAVSAIRAEALPRIEARLDKSPPLAPNVVAELQRLYTVPAPVRSWRMVGPFAEGAPPPFDPAAPDFAAEYADVRKKPARWQEVRADRSGKVDVTRQGYSPSEHVAAFAAAELVSPAAATVEMKAGCDDGIVVWVNGKKVFEQLGDRAYTADEFRFKADLRPGKNLLVAKSVQGGGQWEFSVSVPPPGSGRLFRAVARAAGAADYARFAADTPGDPARGRVVFNDLKGAGCVKCHKDGSPSPGGDVGPSLAGIGAKYNRRQLIESVLYPSKQILDGYQQTKVEMADGRVFVGIARGETATELVLVDAEGKRRALKKSDIEGRAQLNQSLMPDGLHAGLSLQEFADLISYLEGLKPGVPGGP
jgi:putative membrane-bound dehydrogenase-like protein